MTDVSSEEDDLVVVLSCLNSFLQVFPIPHLSWSQEVLVVRAALADLKQAQQDATMCGQAQRFVTHSRCSYEDQTHACSFLDVKNLKFVSPKSN